MSNYIPPVPPSEPGPDRPMARVTPTDATPSPPPDLDPDDEADVLVTFFTDYAAATKRERQIDLPALADLIRNTAGAEKSKLPWLKCARFGDIRSENNSLRNNDNVRAITGIELDYDGEKIGFDAAVEKLRAAGILGILYTSPSHTEDSPRWRALCVLSQEYPPDQRERFLARLNGLLGGIASNESWTLSQSYYYGSVNKNPSHRVELLDGIPIDQANHLDATAIGKPEKPEGKTRPSYPAADPSLITDKRLTGLVNKLLGNISAAAKGTIHDTLLIQARTLGGYAHLLPYSDEQLIGMLLRALPADDHPDPKTERQTALDGLKHGKLSPLTLEERPRRTTGNGAAAPGKGTPEPAPASDHVFSNPEPEPEEAAPEAPEPERKPPSLADLTMGDLAAMDEVAFGKIAKAKAALMGITATVLAKARSAARAAAAKATRDAEKATKAAVDAAKAEAKEREKEAKEQERTDKKTAAGVKKKARPALKADVDDGLGRWTPPQPDALAEILVVPGERHLVADAGLAAMADARVPYYQRGKDLVRVSRINLKQSDGEPVRVPAIAPVTKPMLLRAMGRTAIWQTYSKEFDMVQIDPPSDLGDHILGMQPEWPFPVLRGVVATQTMRFDGTLLTEPGYDPSTGLVLFNPPTLPTMPEHPTKADALEALAFLNGLLTGFDFAEDDGVSRAGAASMLMTGVLRGMMPAAPIHFITKPDAGSGGSYMQDLMSAIAIGERCPTLSLTLHNDEENEKRLSAAAYSGQPIIAIDNFVGTLMGNFFCQLIDRPMPQIRLLGKTEMATIPNNHFVVANGINITIGIDAIRRGVRIELDPNRENPAERSFTRDPVAEMLVDRGPAVAAILTIARAYHLAGKPGRLTPRPSFEVWSDNVRSALGWLGWPDVDESIKTARGEDPHTNKLVAVMTAWAKDLTVGLGYRVSELVTEASSMIYASDGCGGQRNKPDLWDALFDVAGNKQGGLDAVRLGTWLRDHKNRVVGKHKLISDTSDKSRPKWKLAS